MITSERTNFNRNLCKDNKKLQIILNTLEHDRQYTEEHVTRRLNLKKHPIELFNIAVENNWLVECNRNGNHIFFIVNKDLISTINEKSNPDSQQENIINANLSEIKSKNNYDIDLAKELNNLTKVCEEQFKLIGDDSSKTSTGQKRFDKAIYNALPSLLKGACNTLTDDIEKEVFLVGALGMISGLLPNVKGMYDSKYYTSNLYVYILANYGVGKGSLSLCKHLGQPIHKKKKQAYEEEFKEYQAQLENYDRYKRKKSNNEGEEITKPEHPKKQLLFIPANNSKTGAFELLSSNNGNGIIFETEGDTIADATKQDYGNYSDGLRKAFHHETISYYRRTEKEHVEIESPALSVIISSTFGQFTKLIPSIENGLYSRFLYYELKGNDTFKNVFDKRKRNYNSYMEHLGFKFKDYYLHLETLESPIIFSLQERQENTFLEIFQKWKRELNEYVSKDLDGTVNRLGLICFRIAMIFTALRMFDNGEDTNTIVCNDTDFNNAIAIVGILKYHSLKVFYKLNQQQTTSKKEKIIDKADKLIKAKELRKTGLSYNKIAEQTGEAKTTVYRWLNN